MKKSPGTVVDSEESLGRYLRENPPATRELPRDLRELVACIHNSLFEPELTVKKLKVRCRIRNNNISTRFRYLVGRGIKEYIDMHRMEAAGRMLRHSGAPVFEVAMSVGYKHVETFYQVFHRYYGCTPGAYARESEGAGEPQVADPAPSRTAQAAEPP